MNPVITQPGPCVAGAMVSDWQTGLFDCCSDMGVCLCGACLPIILSCQIASDMHECCLCGGSIAMRTMYRTRYGIPGSILNDYIALAFCYPCALCQLKRDINRRKVMNAL